MAVEIERKFLVTSTSCAWRTNGELLRQGYLSVDKQRTVRVRVQGERSFLTVKGISKGAVRTEFEYVIPLQDAEQMLEELCVSPPIEKTRYRVPIGNHVWEVDDFHGANAGLVVAEIELSHEHEAFKKPSWVAEEITLDPRYFNSHLLLCPYTTWSDESPKKVIQ